MIFYYSASKLQLTNEDLGYVVQSIPATGEGKRNRIEKGFASGRHYRIVFVVYTGGHSRVSPRKKIILRLPLKGENHIMINV